MCVRFYQRKDGKVVTQDCMSILGTATLREKYPVLALINAGLSTIALIIMPLFGPAFVTIIQGMGPKMASDEDYVQRHGASKLGSEMPLSSELESLQKK